MPRKFAVAGIVAASAAAVFLLTPSFLRAPAVPTAEEPQVILPDGNAITVEVARTAYSQAQGLSNRKSLGETHGMLFVYARPTMPSFWMKGMQFPIDIIWIDDGRVLGILPDLSPDTFPQTFSPPALVTHVLEVHAGFAARHGLAIGDILELRLP